MAAVVATTENFGRPTNRDKVLPLERRQILDWSAAFGTDGMALWEDTALLAGRFWAASDGEDRQVAWHHLVMAVGNFKRQTPIHMGECLTGFSEVPADAPSEMVLPGGSRLARDEAPSWTVLTDMRGLGVATSTTLLSALWPGTHVIIDRLAWTAAVGLRAAEGLGSIRVGPDDGQPLPEITWADYDEYLPWIRATASATDTSPRDVERTLYQLPRKVPQAESRSWREFGGLLTQMRPPE